MEREHEVGVIARGGRCPEEVDGYAARLELPPKRRRDRPVDRHFAPPEREPAGVAAQVPEFVRMRLGTGVADLHADAGRAESDEQHLPGRGAVGGPGFTCKV